MTSPISDGQILQQIQLEFEQRYKNECGKAILIFIPYSIATFGINTDHQGGLITGFPINKGLYFYVGPSNDQIDIKPLDYQDTISFNLSDIPKTKDITWKKNLITTSKLLQSKYKIKTGIKGILGSNWKSSNLGNSIVKSLAYLLALSYFNEIKFSKNEILNLIQNIEKEYQYCMTSLFDQNIVLYGSEDYLNLIDTYYNHSFYIGSPNTSYKPMLVLIQTSANSKTIDNYNNLYSNKIKFKETVNYIKSHIFDNSNSDVTCLREIQRDILIEIASDMNEPHKQRINYFLDESKRVHDGVEAYKNGLWEEFGYLITRGGISRITNYENKDYPLIPLWTIVKEAPGCIGTRFCNGILNESIFAYCYPDRFEEFKKYVITQVKDKNLQIVEQIKITSCEPHNGILITDTYSKV